MQTQERFDILKYVLASQDSDFYRSRIGTRTINLTTPTETEWRKVPFLLRDEITASPLWSRTYVPRADVPAIRNTYGSSGKRTLITPRSAFGSYDNPYAEMRVKRLMNFFASAHNESPQIDERMQQWFGDVGNLDASAAIAARAKIDMLYTTPYTALIFADLLKKYDGLSSIRAVQLTGERCSPIQYKKLQEKYPNASIYSNYGTSETRETIAVACHHDRARGGSLVMEAVPEIYAEIASIDSDEIIDEAGVYGELVLTTLVHDVPFPLVRYRTGDIAVYVPRECECEKVRRGFEVIGRTTVFPIRLVKGEITVNAVEEALIGLEGVSSDYFEVHYFEEEAGETALSRISLYVLCAADENLSALAEKIATRLRVFPTYTYAQGMIEGMYLPLTVLRIDAAPNAPLGKPKAPIVVRHNPSLSMTVQQGDAARGRS